MELKAYLKILWKNLWLVVLAAILICIISYFLTLRQKTTYNGFKTITINRTETAVNPNYYQYDGYYAAESAALQAGTFASWLNTSSSVTELYKTAGQPVPQITDKKLKSYIIVANTLNASSISVSMSDLDESKLDARLSAIETVSNNYFNTKPDRSYYTINFSKNAVSSQQPNSKTNAIAGFVGGLFIGIVAAFAIEYFKA